MKGPILTRGEAGGYPSAVGRLLSFALYTCIVLSSSIPAFAAAPAYGSPAGSGEGPLRRVEEALGKRGIPFEERSLLAGYGDFGSSVFVDFPGTRGNSASADLDRIVVALPLEDGPDGGAGVSEKAAIALASSLSASPCAVPVRIAFLAGERSSLPEDLRGRRSAGLRDLLEAAGAPDRGVFIYLDLVREGAPAELFHGAAGRIAPLGLLRALTDSAAAAGFYLPIALPFDELYRLGLVQGPEELRLLAAADAPALLLREAPRRSGDEGRPAWTAAKLAAALRGCADALSSRSFSRDERYTLLSAGTAYLPLTESWAVGGFLACAAAALAFIMLYSLTHRRLMVARGKVLLLRAWIPGVFFLLILSCLHLAGLLMRFALGRDALDSGGFNPNGAAALVLLGAAAAYHASAVPFYRWAAPKRPHFYSVCANLALGLGALVAVAFDVTFVPVFLWAFALSLLSSLFKEPTLAFVPAALAPAQMAIAAAALAGSGDASAARLLVGGDLRAELLTAFAVLPYAFLFKRVSLLSRTRTARLLKRRKPEFFGHRIATGGLLAAGSVLAVFAFAGDAAAHPVRAPERERAQASAAELGLEASGSTFLGRRLLKVEFAPREAPARIDLYLDSDGPLSIYDAGAPFAYTADGSGARFELGEAPPSRFSLELTLPADQRGALRAEAVYTRRPDGSKGGPGYARTVYAGLPLPASP